MAETHWNNLGAYLKETQILGSIQNTLYWDQNTGMPKKGASWRSEQLTYIAKVLHERNSSEEFSNLIQSAKNELADICLLYTSPSPRDSCASRMPSSA